MPSLDEYSVLVRTTAAIEPYHVHLLVAIATPKAGQGRYARAVHLAGSLATDELAELLHPDERHLVGPMLATLERESLIENVGAET